jgi:dolichol kinase
LGRKIPEKPAPLLKISPDRRLKESDRLNFKAELKRKIIHLSCALLPLMYYFFLNREQILVICSIICILFLIAEFLRFKNKYSNQLFERIFFPLLREEEKQVHITGATYLFISATVTFFIFKKEIAVPAVLILTVADSFAAIVGKMTDSSKFFHKSLAGSATFFIISLVILYLFLPELGWLLLLVASSVTILEALPIPVNDNIIITLSTGILLYLVL